MPTMKFATVEGIKLHYTLEGLPSGPPLVFINSLGTNYHLWDKLIPYFVDNFPIVRYDKRGHGLSDCPPGPYSISDHANDLAGLLEHLNIKEAILIGISVGGMIALEQASRQPQSVKALVLCDTAAKIGTTESWNERIEAIRQNGLSGMAGTILGRWFTAAFAEQDPAGYQAYQAMLTQTPVAGYLATCAAIQDADLSEPAKTIRTKALVLGGADDLSTPPQVGRELAGMLSEARFEVIEQAGHLPCVEQPEAMAQKILQFFRENGYV